MRIAAVSWLAVAGLALAGCEKAAHYELMPEVAAAAKSLPDAVDYNWDVRPILSQNCFSCHGNSVQKAGLRLDTSEAAYARIPDDQTRRAIVPGNLGASELVRRVTSVDPEYRMPTRESHKLLSPREIAVLVAWVRQGARYDQHWAYLAPKAIAPAADAWPARTINTVDQYVHARLAREGLEPAAEADRETLINRVTLDLTGLPPTLEQVDAFVADTRPDAYEKLVDRLLASRQYAERQASSWMDVARYADSSGFLFDTTGRYQYPYRDWVTSAFERNLPYDQFVTWQIAGDKLPAASHEQVLATAFLRMGKQSNEGGIIDEEYRVEYGLERTELMGRAFMGLTVGCAKCHDHKYDVISQKDFYSMFAFFNQADERGIGQWAGYATPMGPGLPIPTRRQAEALAAAHELVRAREQAYESARQVALRDAADAASGQATAGHRGEALKAGLERDLVAWYPLDASSTGPIDKWLVLPNGLPVVLANDPAAPSPLNLSPYTTGLANTSAKDDPELPHLANFDIAATAMKGPAFVPPPTPPQLPQPLFADKFAMSPSGIPGAPPAGLYNIKFVPGAHGQAAQLDDSVGMADYHVGFFERTDPFTLEAWVKLRDGQPYEEVNLIYNRFQPAGLGGPGYELQLVGNRLRFRLVHKEPYNELAIVSKPELPKGKWLHLAASYDGSSHASGAHLYVDGKLVETDVEHDRLTRSSLPHWGRGVFDSAVGLAWGKSFTKSEFKGGAIDEIKVYTRALTPLEVAFEHDPALADGIDDTAVREQIAEVAALHDARVMGARAAYKRALLAEQAVESDVYQVPVMGDTLLPRKTWVLDHGLYNVPKADEQVEPRALERVFPWNAKLPANRLGLAQWLFDPKNPLTARVNVNRLWQGHFGTGIVETVEDFGTQGSIPTHPELLDWLALEFRQSGWDIRHMHRLMVMSATYRQSSAVSADAASRDPRNLLLARGPRYRLPAETIRDSALAASGLLVDKAGGDAVFPYQPQGVWDSIGVPQVPYPTGVPDDQLHRRSMYTFIRRNAAFPSLVVFDMPDRNISTVARRISNTPLQALVLLNDPQFVEAYRKLAERAIKCSTSGDGQLVALFRLATRRHPTGAELDAMRRYHGAEAQRLARDPRQAARLLKVGAAPVDASIPAVELAALTMVTAGVMNSPDAYTLR